MTISKFIINGEEHGMVGGRRYRRLEIDAKITPAGYIQSQMSRTIELSCRINDNLGPIEVGDVLIMREDAKSPVYPESIGGNMRSKKTKEGTKEETKEEVNEENTKGGLTKTYPIGLYVNTSIGIYDTNNNLLQEFFFQPYSCTQTDYLINVFEAYLSAKEAEHSGPSVDVGANIDSYVYIGEVSNLKISCQNTSHGPFNVFLLRSQGFTNSVIPGVIPTA